VASGRISVRKDAGWTGRPVSVAAGGFAASRVWLCGSGYYLWIHRWHNAKPFGRRKAMQIAAGRAALMMLNEPGEIFQGDVPGGGFSETGPKAFMM